MQTISITFAEKPFVVNPLTIGASRVWRTKFQEQLKPLIEALGKAQGIQLDDMQALAHLGEVARVHLLGAPDTVFDMLCDYAPNLAAERAWIEANAYDDEVVRAFVEVIKLAFPLGGLVRLMSGPATKATLKN